MRLWLCRRRLLSLPFLLSVTTVSLPVAAASTSASAAAAATWRHAAAAAGVLSAAVQRAAALRGGLAEGGVVALLASHLMTRGISFRQSKLSTARYSTTQRHAAERQRQKERFS
eukprot:COSAG06_NODE_11363_length_1521_cov_23.841069_2_plen_114_part_00